MTLDVNVEGFYLIEAPTSKIVATAKIKANGISFFGKVVNGANGIFFAPPSTWNKKTEKYDNVLFFERDLHDAINAAVEKAYRDKGTAPKTVPAPTSSVAAPSSNDFCDDIPF